MGSKNPFLSFGTLRNEATERSDSRAPTCRAIPSPSSAHSASCFDMDGRCGCDFDREENFPKIYSGYSPKAIRRRLVGLSWLEAL